MSLPLAIVAEPSPCDTRRLLLIDGDTERAHDFARAIAEESTVLVCVDDADVERVRTIAPDVVIAHYDAVAPDDFALLGALTRLEDAAPMPVLVIVDDSSSDRRLCALRAGAGDCLLWPSDPAELTARVDGLVRLARRMRSLWNSSYRDPLTGLLNRRGMLDALRREIERAARSSESLALLFIDLDGFKQINDRHGHDVGDRLLKCAADLLAAEVRAGDVVARLGGDEFVIVLPRRDMAGAESLATRLEARLDSLLPHYELGASAGIASLSQPHNDVGGAEELLRRADRAMYARKRIRSARFAHAKG